VTEEDLEKLLPIDLFRAMREYVKPEQRRDFDKYYNVADVSMPSSPSHGVRRAAGALPGTI
jgi:hypothetical protein